MTDGQKQHQLFFEGSEFHVRWVCGSVLVSVGDDSILLDAPPGVTNALVDANLLQTIRTLAFSSGRLDSVGDFIPLMSAMERYQSAEFPFIVRAGMGDERPGILVEAWSTGWPGRFPIGLDMIRPGFSVDVGPLTVQTVGVEMGEPTWLDSPCVSSCVGVGWRIERNDQSVVWVKSCVPTPAIQRLCRDATLVILEVGVKRWPKSDRRWRMSIREASEYGALAQDLWLVGDDGGPLRIDLLS